MLHTRRVGDDDAYRRGTLFGFTLAEIVLLIIFALLLALTALLVAKEQRIDELMKASEGMVRVMPGDAKLIEAVKDAYRFEGRAVPPVDELFRELRLALEARAQVPKGLADARLVEAARKLGELLARGTDKSDGRIEIDMLTRALEPLGTEAALEGKSPIDLILSVLQRSTQARNEAKAREEQIADLNRKVGRLEAELAEAGRNNLPPIVRIPTNNSFRLGEATLLPEFRSRLTEAIIPDLKKTGEAHDIEVIEVVGHTDELPIANSRSNLDTALLPFLNRRGNEADLVAADNAGLGLARAAAVARVLVADPRLERFRILPLSAGQVVDKDQRISTGTISGDAPDRRRIEIRMRRLNIETRDGP